MSADLTKVLEDWPYEPGKVNVRVIQGEDGEPRIQVRLDLGVLQMHAEGRPDGHRPHGFGSLLEYHEDLLDQREGREEGQEGDEEPFTLSPEECRALREEAIQYYYRYTALLALEDFDGVVRDTTRNLRVLDLCRQYAQTDEDKTLLEQYRPYITMIRARALAGQALKDNEPKAAIHAIDEGLEALRQYFMESDRPDHFDQAGEVQALRGMRDALVPKLPVSLKHELHERLAQALQQENYELAAILRDEIRMLRE